MTAEEDSTKLCSSNSLHSHFACCRCHAHNVLLSEYGCVRLMTLVQDPLSPPVPTRTMESLKAKLSAHPDSISRTVTLLGSLLVALSSGTNYVRALDTA